MKTQTITTDIAVHPGRLLADELEAREMTQTDLAAQMNRPIRLISDLVNERKRLTAETALQLEAVLGIAAKWWLNLQSDYDLTKARQKLDAKAG